MKRQRVSEPKPQAARQLRRSMTPAERAFWKEFRARRHPGFKFRRQQVIAGFVVDFYCDALGLVVEIDGPIHDTTREEDAERDLVLLGLGLHVMHFSNHEILHDLDSVVRRITSFRRR